MSCLEINIKKAEFERNLSSQVKVVKKYILRMVVGPKKKQANEVKKKYR